MTAAPSWVSAIWKCTASAAGHRAYGHELNDVLQVPRPRLSHLLSVQARNLPPHRDVGLEQSAAFFVLWAHAQPGPQQQQQPLFCVYTSEQVRISLQLLLRLHH